jgi:hypothetical protein
MSEPARKSDIDIEEFERRLRPASPQVEDPLAELARLVGGAEPPRLRQPVEALAPQARAGLTLDEEQFLNELSLSVANAIPPAEQLDRAQIAIQEAAVEAHKAAAEAHKAAADAQKLAVATRAVATQDETPEADAPAVIKAQSPQPNAPAALDLSAAVVIPALKSQTALRGGLDLRGLEEMTRLDPIARAPAAASSEPRPLPRVDLNAPVFPPRSAPAPAPLDTAIRFEETPLSPRDLDASLPGDERYAEPAALAAAPAAPRAQRSRRAIAAVVALVGVGVATVGVGLTLKRGPRAASGEPPTIMASADPVKVAPPAAPAAAADQTEDLLARKPVKADAGAKAVGRPEEPVNLASEAQKIVKTVPVDVTIDPSIARTPTGDSATPDRLSSVFPEPKRVRTISIRPDGTLVGAAAPAPAQSPAPVAAAPVAPVAVAPVKIAAAPPPPPIAVTPPPIVSAPSSAALSEEAPVDKPRAKPAAAKPAAQTPSAALAKRPTAEKPAKPGPKAAANPAAKPAAKAAVKPAAKPAEAETDAPEQAAAPAPVEETSNPFAKLFGSKEQTAAPAPATTASVEPDDEAPKPARAASGGGSGSYGVQLSSSPSESDARGAASRLGSRFSSALGGRSPRVVKGEAAGKTVYRVRVGGMSKDGAASACGNVKSSGGSCFVTHD